MATRKPDMPSEASSLPDETHPRSDGAPRFRLLRRVALVALVALALGTVAWYVAIPYPWSLHTENPRLTAVMEQRALEAREQGEAFQIRHEWIPLAQMSPHLVRAVIVAEDYRFRHHAGIDWVSLAEEVSWQGDESFEWWSPSDLGALRDALMYAWVHREELRGRSTITQQLAKNLYFGTDRSFTRKAVEAVVAGRLERRLEKDRILELYLNVAEWGPGVFGAEAAARTYFGRSARSLTLEQAAALAATLPHPLSSNPHRSPSRMLWRKEVILRRLDPSPGPELPIPPPIRPVPELDLDIDFREDFELPALDELPAE